MGYSKETERQNKALGDVLAGRTPEKRVMVGYEGKKQENGDQISRMTDIMKETRMPMFCPVCDVVMKKKLDNKFWRMFGHCFDCQIKFENKLRIEGKYEEWEKEKIRNNKISFIKEAIQKIEEWKDMKAPEWYNNVGLVTPEVDKEKWEITKQQREDMTKLANEAIDRFDKMKIEIEEELVNINS